MNKCQKMFLIAQKKRPDALNATQKNPSLLKCKVSEEKKQEKKLTNLLFVYVLVKKNGYFYEVFIDFSKITLQRAGVFSVAFNASGRFL